MVRFGFQARWPLFLVTIWRVRERSMSCREVAAVPIERLITSCHPDLSTIAAMEVKHHCRSALYPRKPKLANVLA